MKRSEFEDAFLTNELAPDPENRKRSRFLYPGDPEFDRAWVHQVATFGPRDARDYVAVKTDDQIEYFMSLAGVDFEDPLPVLARPESPNVLVQAAIERLDGTAEGDLVVLVWPAFDALVRMLLRDPDALYKIDPRKMEELVAGSYDGWGFDEVVLTPRSGDLGRDVVATKWGQFKVRIIDQVKAFRRGRVVDANDVRALLGVLGSDHSVSKGYVTTTADFAPRIKDDPYIAPYLETRLELVNGKSFLHRLAQIATGAKAWDQPIRMKPQPSVTRRPRRR